MASAAKGEDALDGDGNPQGHKDAEAFANAMGESEPTALGRT
jgi:hypothetical protein